MKKLFAVFLICSTLHADAMDNSVYIDTTSIERIGHLSNSIPTYTKLNLDDGMSLTVEWIGHPVINDGDKYFPSDEWLPNIEIGLRSDGVVVWRKK